MRSIGAGISFREMILFITYSFLFSLENYELLLYEKRRILQHCLGNCGEHDQHRIKALQRAPKGVIGTNN